MRPVKRCLGRKLQSALDGGGEGIINKLQSWAVKASIHGLGRPPGEGNATHSSILAWEIPGTEEPGGLQSMGSQKSWT